MGSILNVETATAPVKMDAAKKVAVFLDLNPFGSSKL
jgi:hypothetical protein